MPPQSPSAQQQQSQAQQHLSMYDGSLPLVNQHHLHPELRNAQSPQAAPTANMHSQFTTSRSASSQPPPDLPPHARLPVNVTATCPLDSILLDFLADRRLAVERGHPLSIVAGPSQPSLSAFLDPAAHRDAHPMSTIMLDILSKFPDLHATPERLASFYIMFAIMRWQVAPTQEAYEQLPEFMRPTRIQLERPHPAWVDEVPW